jgi:hypothetical protein
MWNTKIYSVEKRKTFGILNLVMHIATTENERFNTDHCNVWQALMQLY